MLAATAALGLAPFAGAGADARADEPVVLAEADPRLQSCLIGMMRGYQTGLDETFCRSVYDLPSPFFFKCAQNIRIGFESETERAACVAFLETARDKADAGRVRPTR